MVRSEVAWVWDVKLDNVQTFSSYVVFCSFLKLNKLNTVDPNWAWVVTVVIEKIPEIDPPPPPPPKKKFVEKLNKAIELMIETEHNNLFA